MFRASTIIRELALNLAKVVFILKHLVELCRYLLCGCVAACHGMACVLHAVQNVTQSHSAQHATGSSSGSMQLSLSKVILILKHSVRLRRNLLCGCVAACCHTAA